jgi:hypothetical protein
MMPFLANHVWQSTLVGGAAILLTALLRQNRASLRFAIWLAASMKFFVPFAALLAFGRQFSWRAPLPLSSTGSGAPLSSRAI